MQIVNRETFTKHVTGRFAYTQIRPDSKAVVYYDGKGNVLGFSARSTFRGRTYTIMEATKARPEPKPKGGSES